MQNTQNTELKKVNKLMGLCEYDSVSLGSEKKVITRGEGGMCVRMAIGREREEHDQIFGGGKGLKP